VTKDATSGTGGHCDVGPQHPAKPTGARLRRRSPPDLQQYVLRASERCFICAVSGGEDEYGHHIVYEDDLAVAFLNRFPVVEGYVLVAPREHLEQVTGDFSEDEYAALQRVVHRVGEAIRRAFTPERLYVLSLGSQDANAHTHWHLVPLPAGVPFQQQQLAFLSWDVQGILDLSGEEMSSIAERIRAQL
jgi:diadenosine tetraphosphate (Ap4A) HIT family hydrolase